MCWTLNHQNILEIAQGHISLSEAEAELQGRLAARRRGSQAEDRGTEVEAEAEGGDGDLGLGASGQGGELGAGARPHGPRLSHPGFGVQNPSVNIITRCAGTKSHTYDESWHRIECHNFTI
jgi:hypothetical protein